MGGCEISHIKYSSVLGEAVAIAGRGILHEFYTPPQTIMPPLKV